MSTSQYDLSIAEPHLRRLLNTRDYPKTICPSEVARALSSKELKEAGTKSWRDLMPAIREYAFELRDAGDIEIMQKGQVIPTDQNCNDTVGPIRLRLVSK